jgi:AcrR family transcriptional regulator
MSAPMERGRPRNAGHDAAILDAAVALLIERGPEAASVEAIARRAGVAKLTVYRRWKTKGELLIAAIEHVRGPDPQPFGPDASMEDVVRSMAKQLSRQEYRDLAARMIGAVVDHPELVQAYSDRHLKPRLIALADIAQRSIDAGMFPAGSDPEVIRDALFGVVGPVLQSRSSSAREIEARLRKLLYQLGYRSVRSMAAGHERAGGRSSSGPESA